MYVYAVQITCVSMVCVLIWLLMMEQNKFDLIILIFHSISRMLQKFLTTLNLLSAAWKIKTQNQEHGYEIEKLRHTGQEY